MNYYEHPDIQKHIYNFLQMHEGNSDPELSTAEKMDDLRRNLTGPEYIAYTTPETARNKGMQGRPSPARSVKPWVLPQLFEENPKMELFAAQWQTDAKGQESLPLGEISPFRVPLIWDIEYYNFTRPDIVLTHQLEVYQKLEEVYLKMKEVLQSYGVPFLSTMSGRGYHFVTSTTPEAYQEMLNISGNIDNDLQDYQASIPAADGVSKRDRSIPPKVEHLFRSACRIQEFIFLEAMSQLKNSQIPINISDIGPEGISMDNTGMVRNSGTAVMGVLGSMYLKPWLYGSKYSQGAKDRTKQIHRIARSKQGNEPHNLGQLVWQRQNIDGVVENLNTVGSGIPTGDQGITKIIRHYKTTPLYALYSAMDGVDINPRQSWRDSYRANDYGYLYSMGRGIAEIMDRANPTLLTPEGLDYFVNTVFDAWGGNNNLSAAKHVQGLLQAIYEDPRFNWLGRFTRHNMASRHAQGWVEMILGKRVMLG